MFSLFFVTGLERAVKRIHFFLPLKETILSSKLSRGRTPGFMTNIKSFRF